MRTLAFRGLLIAVGVMVAVLLDSCASPLDSLPRYWVYEGPAPAWGVGYDGTAEIVGNQVVFRFVRNAQFSADNPTYLEHMLASDWGREDLEYRGFLGNMHARSIDGTPVTGSAVIEGTPFHGLSCVFFEDKGSAVVAIGLPADPPFTYRAVRAESEETEVSGGDRDERNSAPSDSDRRTQR